MYATGIANCDGLWALCLVISYTRQVDLLQALGSASCDITYEKGLRVVTVIGLCVL